MARRRKPEPVEDDDDLEEEAPRRSARRAVDEDDEPADDLSRPRDDAYTGLLMIALVALIGACLFWYLDNEALSGQQISPPTVNVGGLGQQPANAG